MKAINVVVVDDVERDIVNGLVCIWIARVEEPTVFQMLLTDRAFREPFRVSIEDMVAGRRIVGSGPDEVADKPAVNFDPRRSVVAFLYDRLKRIEVGRDERGARFVGR